MDTKKILGLDLGVSSIGWALIEEGKESRDILGMGSRIVPLSPDDTNEFSSGNAISKNAKRRQKRTIRRGYDRYQLRRNQLGQWLQKQDMVPDDKLMKLPPLELWQLRAKAARSPIKKHELGRVLYHLNQKRGYKGTRAEEASADKKETEYVAEVRNRHQIIKEADMTVGQWFFDHLQTASNEARAYRIKDQVLPREAYMEEFDAIMAIQAPAHGFSEKDTKDLRDRVIFYQRPLKSQKKLVSTCEFEGKYRTLKNGQVSFTGPNVAPRSSPLFQTCKILESIQNIRLTNRRNEVRPISLEEKQRLFHHLNANRTLSEKKLFQILKIDPKDGWYGNKQTAKGIQGNTILADITDILGEDHPLTNFTLDIKQEDAYGYIYDKDTGEVVAEEPRECIDPSFQNQPLYQLWHTIYSIKDLEECQAAIQDTFRLEAGIARQLAALDFNKYGFGNKSSACIRKILPYLMKGHDYTNACSLAGYNHSNSFTKEEILKRQLKDTLPYIKKNSLRQPVVEKILNQMIGVVNAIILKWGKPDEIRIELARELKQSKDERYEAFSANSKREREGKQIIERIETEYGQFGVKASRRNILKWRLFHEISNQDMRVNAICLYCGKPFGITDAMRGSAVDVDHIIPRSLLFDDSQSNKILVHRHCNQNKDNMTAFDFMTSKGESELSRYIAQVDELFRNKVIGYGKKNKLLMASSKIPKDFIDRQLRETQYITRKAREILEQVCYQVWNTSGQVTSYLRHLWGWDDVLMNLQLPKYRELGMTEWKEFDEGNGMIRKMEIITGWSKRDDHRHHAIDALTVACTKQGFIQRLNTLSASRTRESMRADLGDQYNAKKNLMDNYFQKFRPFTTRQIEEKAEGILISFKPGKKITTPGSNRKGRKPQYGVYVPRGPLSEETVYGKIKTLERKPAKELFECVDLIVKDRIRELVSARLLLHNGDIKKAQQSLKKQPIFLDKEGKEELAFGSCYKEEVVVKKSLAAITTLKQAESIVDHKIRALVTERLEQFSGQEKKAFAEPLYSDTAKTREIRSVRFLTGLDAVVPLHSDSAHAFVKPGNNHHVAIYRDAEGKLSEHICTFWHAVERKLHGIQPIIENTNDMWDSINHGESLPDHFLENLPPPHLELVISMQQGEMFTIGLEKHELEGETNAARYKIVSKHCYRVQKLSSMFYVFRHHLETNVDESSFAQTTKKFIRISSLSTLLKSNILKIKIDKIGQVYHD